MSVAAPLSPVQERLRKARLYCITLSSPRGTDVEVQAKAACRGGADILQLRDKGLSAREFTERAARLAGICRRYGALFIVNDRLDVALAAGADGVHLGQDDLPLAEAQKIARGVLGAQASGFLIGISTHSLAQARAAEAGGADYVGCGPIFSTPTKPDAAPVGLELVRRYRAALRIPFVAIGGIDASNLDPVLRAGASCAAVVRAAFGSSSVEEAVRSLKAVWERAP